MLRHETKGADGLRKWTGMFGRDPACGIDLGMKNRTNGQTWTQHALAHDNGNQVGDIYLQVGDIYLQHGPYPKWRLTIC